MQALLLIIPHTTVPHWTQRNTGKTREKGGKSLGTLQSTLQPQMWLEGPPMLASQLLDLLQGQTCDPGTCRMGLQGHRSVLEPTDARVLGSTVSLSQQPVKGTKVIIGTPFRGNTNHKDDSQGGSHYCRVNKVRLSWSTYRRTRLARIARRLPA